MALPVPQSTSVTTATSSSSNFPSTSPRKIKISCSQLRFSETKQAHLRLMDAFKGNSALQVKALRESQGLTQEIINNEQKCVQIMDNESELFKEMKHRFLTFKKDKYLENLEHFQNLAKVQKPKNGPSETNAALEFSVNSLEVENILVVGHSCCGGIRALMSMEDNKNSSSFIENWVRIGKPAKLISTKATATASDLNFDQQCRHCEKVSINQSLLNLLTYPWIEEKVANGKLSVHGGYYDFVDCTFEKWSLNYKGSESKEEGEYSIKDREFWC
ncbi:beta carbonic anhydrase 5, chloroplastic-like isoform X4 [Coffea arabica]|uniref:Carbonic anhydrase n=1 Tax=Coffea arabica TaxID=13443 RepID=A0ABM4WH39_COFAR